MLSVDNVHFAYENPILRGVSFKLLKGEIVALIGTSGSGKTTLFRLITRLLKPSKGSVSCLEEATYMQQEDLLLAWRTIIQNILLPFELGESKKLPLLEAQRLLNLVGLEGYSDAYPKELSGGMRQRVSLARALLQDRPLMLLDEPFGSLDVLIREQLYQLLKQSEKTILLVTHDFRDALEVADRILILSEGVIVDDYTVKNHEPEQLKCLIRSSLQSKHAPLNSNLDEHKQKAPGPQEELSQEMGMPL